MAHREVTMLEVKEVLRLWLAGVPKKRIAAGLGLVEPVTEYCTEMVIENRTTPGGRSELRG